RRRSADTRSRGPADERHAEQHRAESHLHASGWLLRPRQLHVQGQRRDGRFGGGDGQSDGRAREPRARRGCADRDDCRRYGQGGRVDGDRRRRRPADLQRRRRPNARRAERPLAALSGVGPPHGPVMLNANGSLTYTPAANYNGPDSFTYKANDGTLNSNVATVTITVTPVNDPPVANAQSVTTNQDTAK